MIICKTEEQIRIMAEAGKKLARIMEKLEKMVKPGLTTENLNRVAETLIFECGAIPVFKGYEGFPAALCTSVNHQLVHTPPSDYCLKSGDILTLDLGLKYRGFCADMAKTMAVGKIKPEAAFLIETTKKALEIGIKKLKPNHTFGDVSAAIQKFVEERGFQVVRELCGHGIGKELHEDPQILNYGRPGEGEKIKEGMVVCLEPMVTVGHWRLKKSADGFGYETADGSLSCHFEHTVAVTSRSPLILTK